MAAAAAASAAPSFKLGLAGHEVSMGLFAKNRERLCERLKRRADLPPSAIVFLEGGKATCRHDTDHEELFRQESFFHWTFGVSEPDCLGAVVVATGEAVLFVPRLPEAYAIWMGEIFPPSHFKTKYGVSQVYFTDELQAKLPTLQPSPITVLLMAGKNTDSGSDFATPALTGLEGVAKNTTMLHPDIVECRVIKTAEEAALMRYVCRVTCEAHKEVMRKVRAGWFEFQAESVFAHHSYFTGGCRHTGYTCICATGRNSSVLHYGHAAAANAKIIKPGDMCLFDMGAEYCCYGADVTCSFPVSGKFTQQQAIVYNAVLRANRAVLAAMRPGVAWPDMHGLSYRIICEDLKAAGLLVGDVNEMMAANVAYVFMPHGLGHFLGIDTHDCGGYPEGVERSSVPGFKSLRTARVLAPGMVITVEPGIYFINVTLQAAYADPARSQFFVPERIKEFMDVGGVRLEDDVLVTEDGCELLSTGLPRTVEEIEAFMSSERS